MTAQDFQQVASTILTQMGGKRFLMMTGANNLCNLNNTQYGGLSMKLPANKSKANLLKITLTCDDTYTMEFITFRGLNCKTVATHEMVYAEDLQRFFTQTTGLYTSL